MNIDKPTCSTDNMSDSSDKRFLTDAQQLILANFEQGDYVPTKTNGFAAGNAMSLNYAKYLRMNDFVFVMISFEIVADDDGIFLMYIDLPIPSAMTTAYDLNGVIHIAGAPVVISEDAVVGVNYLTSLAAIGSQSPVVNGQTYQLSGFFMYPVIA